MTAQFSFNNSWSTSMTRTSRKKLWAIFCALCVFFSLSLFHLHSPFFRQSSSTADSVSNKCTVPDEQLAAKKKLVGKNWIVVTTINPPTDAMNLLCNLKEWNVVVVADTKSPKEWECGSCVYLTVEDQQCLKFGITEVIPYRAYTRKNIGYLWAIQQGATTIFDTDDDNLPNTNITFESPTESVITYRTDKPEERSVNVYSHFGRPDVWPRGFPLNEIDIERPVSYLPSYASLPEKERKLVGPPVMIQQGLADLDPDVDAIFRLTQGQELKKIKFCKKSPSIRLSPGSFCPFNSQNTLFSYDAFWGLLLPITVSFRVCDIWRGYWVQRLLWDINGSLGFTKPTVDQIRNAHNYLADYEDELQLYSEASKLVEFLANWSSPSTNLGTRIVDLMKAMAKEKFIGEGDVDLSERWVRDLQNVGYNFPDVTLYNRQAVRNSITAIQKPIVSTDSHRLSFEALNQCKADTTDPSMAKIQIVKDKPRTVDIFNDVLLVVNFNWPLYDAIEPYLSIYKPHFPNIVMYGPDVPEHLQGVVRSVSHNEGNIGYKSLVMAMEEFPNYSGYLYTNDDTLLNVHQLATYDLDKVWKHVPILSEDLRDRSKPPPYSWHWERPGTTDMWNDPTSFTDIQRERIAKFTGIPGPADIRAFCDAVYVPGRISLEVKDVLTRFLKHDVFLELGVGLALIAVEPTENWVDWKESYLWYGGERELWRDYMQPGVGIVHPVKLLKDRKARDDIITWMESVEVV